MRVGDDAEHALAETDDERERRARRLEEQHHLIADLKDRRADEHRAIPSELPAWHLERELLAEIPFQIFGSFHGDERLHRTASIDPLRVHVDDLAVHDDRRNRHELAEFNREENGGMKRDCDEQQQERARDSTHSASVSEPPGGDGEDARHEGNGPSKRSNEENEDERRRW